MKNIAVMGCTLTCDPDGFATISTPPSTSSFAENKGIYSGPLSITVVGSSTGGANKNATGVGSLQPTAQFVQVDGKMVVLENDFVVITATGTTSSGSPTSGPVKVTISSAGQTFVQAE